MQDSLPGSGGEYLRRNRNSLPLAQAFVIAKQEQPVPQNLPAAGTSELVAHEGRLVGTVQVVGGVESLVSNELINAAMELVGAGLGDCVNHAAGGEAVFRG